MILLEDTRQQACKHNIKHKWFESNGIEIRRTKLYCGDYSLPTDQSICLDSKKDIQELISDICGKQHERFRNELIRAQEAGIKLYILVENRGGLISGTKDIYNPTIRTLEDLHKWKNPRLFIMKPSNEVVGYTKSGSPGYKRVQKYPSATKGITLQKACYTLQEKYGCKFIFTTPEDSGKRIIELLMNRK